MTNRPNIGKLGQWLMSWVQPNGSIHGFHNHPVWGDNPFRYLVQCNIDIRYTMCHSQ